MSDAKNSPTRISWSARLVLNGEKFRNSGHPIASKFPPKSTTRSEPVSTNIRAGLLPKRYGHHGKAGTSIKGHGDAFVRQVSKLNFLYS